MKHGIKPTREQRKLLEKWKLDTRAWLVVKDTPDILELVHKHSDKTTKTIHKEKKQ